MKKEIAIFALLFFIFPAAYAFADGFGDKASGGQGGVIVDAYNENDLSEYLSSTQKYMINVHGTIKLTHKIQAVSNKTIQGATYKSAISGSSIELANRQQNFVIKNINFNNSYISISNASNIFITECTFADSQNGMIIIKSGDNITVAWSKFYFPKEPASFISVISNSRVTFHHNWFEGGYGAMPSASHSVIHMYNNYFNSQGNLSGTVATDGTLLLSENNFYEGMNNPINSDSGRKIQTNGNMYVKCSGIINNGKVLVFRPPYNYSLMFAVVIPQTLQDRSGNRNIAIKTNKSDYR